MAPPFGSNGTLPPSRPSTSQPSSSDSQADNSAARVRIFRGSKRKVAKDKKLAKGKSESENTPARTSFSFRYSARSAANGSASATNTAQVTQVSVNNTASYLRCLERKIKLISCKIDSFSLELRIAVSRLCCKIDSCTDKLANTIAMIRDKVDTTGTDDKEIEQDLEWLDAKKVAYAVDLKRRMGLLKTNITSQGADLRRHLERLYVKLPPFAEILKPQLELLDPKIDSHMREFTELIMGLTDRYNTFYSTYNMEV